MPNAEGKVRFAVVGGGWISQGAFMPGVAQTGNAVMTALVTGDPVKADGLAKLYGLKSYRYEDYDTLLKSGEIDAVYIATPNFRHREFAEPALKAGIHVLLEKPMEASLADAEAITRAAEASTAKLMVAYRLHCEPGTVATMLALKDGEIGEPRVFTASFSQTVKPTNHRSHSGYWAGPIPDMGTYPINAVRNAFAAEPIAVSAVAARTGRLECDDVVSVVLTFADGRSASFTCSYSSADVDTFTVIGTDGSMIVSPAFGFGEDVAITCEITKGDASETRTAPVVDQFSGETAYFADCILNDREPEPNGEEGLLDMIVLAAIERALETGQTQMLEPRTRSRRIEAGEKREFPLAEVPDFVNTEVPMD
ncbi:Gfo/Idh/MocA family oxidoreductase [Aurantimonas sp. Leaf443]|uniref:Gfo/Idh/MocA family protein n=1 Tax=Aurantimonas sp. Leaf443 TaxID=1736378 RepID=UPI0006F54438|nr:Gfo/Idh/MocA family oxidoreductase [Aurantimonas sp. Leaf443]KQT86327.1 glucose-fructose oxidoreductase [Aurantimonas sp. Leaf443]